ncbi:MAG: hypothetical protein IR159_09140, partial [Brevundimonas sp.]|nr:hypothetical protein [Brevundimonas sp.]
MAARILAPFAGASLLALALPAAAQDHAHHPTPPAPPPDTAEADPPAGHDMPGEDGSVLAWFLVGGSVVT